MNNLLSSVLNRIYFIVKSIKDSIYFLFVENKNDIAIMIITVFFFFITFAMVRFITKRVKGKIRERIKRHSFLNYLFKHKVFLFLSYIIPLLANYYLLSFYQITSLAFFLNKINSIMITIVILVFVNKTIAASSDFYKTKTISYNLHLTGLFQIWQIIFIIVAIVNIISIVTGKSAVVLFSGLGAVTALLLFMFREGFLSILASIQVQMDHTLECGDWIEMKLDSHVVTGKILDIALFVVKIEGWDNSIIYLPVKNLIEHSYKNYKNVSDMEARRIIHKISIEPESIYNLNDKEIEDYSLESKNNYILKKSLDVVLEKEMIMSNLFLYTEYITTLIKNDKDINTDFPVLIRHTESESNVLDGVSFEVYCFSRNSSIVEFHNDRNRVIDKCFSSLPLFNLKLHSGISTVLPEGSSSHQ